MIKTPLTVILAILCAVFVLIIFGKIITSLISIAVIGTIIAVILYVLFGKKSSS